ncbi:hypothetical protein EVAR_6596_1 [Eumeta japonica]|uniref:Uncharacterized protein n=1 Tax=Eumeta variegata TaxID=151549 RepID=A0A4C1TLL2_EUMVA|nr:hypothetical protein EVAR_6596_1 [Eumeta japonica]
MPIGRDRRSPQSSNLLRLRTIANQHVASGVFWSMKVGHTPRTRVRGSSLENNVCQHAAPRSPLGGVAPNVVCALRGVALAPGALVCGPAASLSGIPWSSPFRFHSFSTGAARVPHGRRVAASYAMRRGSV